VVRALVGLAFGSVVVDVSGSSGSGAVTVTPKAGLPPSGTTGVVVPGYWLEITSTVGGFKSAEVCAPVQVENLSSYGLVLSQLRLFHWVGGVRTDVTTRVDEANQRVCGTVTSFSPFAVGGLKTSRVAGADRYETAVLVSKASFEPGVGVVYVVTGEKFPDAVAAGSVAGREMGPVLLTRAGSLPSVTRDELVRLKPARVVVVGGTSAVAESVVQSVRGAVPGAVIDRVAGVDRYDTAAKLSQRVFSTVGRTVYVGSGLGFTEILAAAAAAGRDGVPLLLVPGSSSVLPLSVAVELDRLKPSRVVVLGGVETVSGSLVSQIQKVAVSASVERVLGIDAYEVAASVASTFKPGGTVYVATGAVFADGLAGGALATVKGSPIMVVPPTGALPVSVTRTMAALQPSRIVVLGGSAAIANNVENQLANHLPQ